MALQPKKLFFLFTWFTLLWQLTVLAQVKFTAKCSPGSIGINETTELRLMIDNAQRIDEIIPPSLNDFTVVSGPNRESGIESNNGVTRQYTGITYLLKPRSTGKFTIRGAVAKADGKIFRSNLVTLEVTKNPSGNNQNSIFPGFSGISPFDEPAIQASFNDYIIKKGENVVDKINKNIFIKVDVSKSACYVGEPVIVTYKLYTRLKSESNITRNPSFNGFSVIDLLPPGNTYYSVEKLNGREYNVYTLRKSQLYPLQAGPVELESAEVENNIHFIREEYLNRQPAGLDDLFRDFTQTTIPPEGMRDEKVTLLSKAALITVKPLPEKDKLPSFTGAVGNFTIDASLEKDSFTTDDAGKLNIVISGAGNMTLIIPPDFVWPNGIEPYEQRSKEQLDKRNVPVSGTKIFEYPFTVARPGSYVIPAIVFSFFDVKEGKYKTSVTKPLSVFVTKGIGKKPAIVTGDSVKTGREQFFETMFTNRWLIIIPVAVLILAGLFIWSQKEYKKDARLAASKLSSPVISSGVENRLKEIAVNPLARTEESLVRQDSRAFCQALNNELKKILADKLGIPPEMISKKSVAEEADRKGLAVYTSLQIQRLMDDIEWQLYTPYAPEDKMTEMYSSAGAIVHALNAITP